MDAAAGHRFETAFRLQAVTGCRRGELLGLRWSDVELPDIGDASVTFRQNLVVVEGGPIIKSLKTETSVRRIPIAPDTAAHLTTWRSLQASEVGEWGTGWSDTGLVFT
jgi:integrase